MEFQAETSITSKIYAQDSSEFQNHVGEVNAVLKIQPLFRMKFLLKHRLVERVQLTKGKHILSLPETTVPNVYSVSSTCARNFGSELPQTQL